MGYAGSLRGPIAWALAVAAALKGPPARAQGDGELAAARKLFAEAVADEDAGRFDTALEKFRRVEAVRTTANVEYRVATCLEALGRRAEALAAFEDVVRRGDVDRGAADTVRASEARVAALSRLVSRLSISVPSTAPAGTRVRVDDAPIDAEALQRPIALDPGPHTVAAEAPGMAPYRTGVTLQEGATASITVVVEPLGQLPAGAPAEGVAPGGHDAPAAPSPASSGPAPPLTYALLGLGGALAAGSIVSFVLRGSNLDTIHGDCPIPGPNGLQCAAASKDEVSSARSAALVEGPLGIALAAGAVVSAGAAVWALMASKSGPPGQGAQLAPVLSPQGGIVVLTGPLPR